MNRVIALLGNPMFALCVWTIALSVAKGSPERTQYVAGWQAGLLVAALIIAGAGILAWLIDLKKPADEHDHHHHSHEPPLQRKAWTALLVQALPLYLLLAIDTKSRTLDGDFDPVADSHALMRVLASDDSGDVQPLDEPPMSEEDARQAAFFGTPETTFNAVPLDDELAERLGMADQATNTNPNAGPLVDLITINRGEWRRRGGRVTVIGRLAEVSDQRLASLKDAFPDLSEADAPSGALYRFVMTCCAADAAPISAMLGGPIPGDIPAHAWVEVSGTALPAVGRKPSMVIIDSVQEVDEPRRPYLVLGPLSRRRH